jgi:hypothetical protein
MGDSKQNSTNYRLEVDLPPGTIYLRKRLAYPTTELPQAMDSFLMPSAMYFQGT